MSRDAISVAVAGAGMAGQAHAFGFRNATMHPDLAGMTVELAAIVDPNAALAASVAERYGFARAEADLEAVLADRSIDAVAMALPNHLYAGAIPRAIAAGKHVLAEKPLGRTAAEALGFAEAADAAGVVHCVGFSWRRLPAVEAIAEIVRSGRLGRVFHASVWYLTDYAATPDTPLSWRYDAELSGGGAIVDVGAHAISVLERVTGPVRSVLAADARTLIAERPVAAGPVAGHGRAELTGETGPVSNDDVTLLLLELADGGSAQVATSRVAAGIPNSLGLQVFGAEGSVSFDSLAPDEFQLYERALAPPEDNGPRRVIVGPGHPYFAASAPMPARGVASGYGAAFVAQAQDFLGAIAEGRGVETDFWSGYRTMLVCDAAQRAAAHGGPVELHGLDRDPRAGATGGPRSVNGSGDRRGAS
jgi:predicted dehydrogenase